MRVLAFEPIWAEAIFVPPLAMLHFQEQRRAAIPVPHLGGVDAMPARHLSCPEQVKDRGRVRAAFMAGLVAEGLAEISSFRVWHELQVRDDLVGSERSRHA